MTDELRKRDTRAPLRLGFLASHGGTSMSAVVSAINAGELAAQARVLICNNAGSTALRFALDHTLPARHISAKTAGSDDAADIAICNALKEHGCNLVVMSGYLRKLGPRTLAAFDKRILNIHPALLPKFGGQGMYGRRVHEAVIAAGETESGATIHLVDREYDHGEIVARRKVPVMPGDTAEKLEQRIAAMEPSFYVDVLKQIAAKAV